MQDLAGRFARRRAFAAGDDETELSFTAFQAFFQRAANGGRDAGRVPVETKNAAERLESVRICDTC